MKLCKYRHLGDIGTLVIRMGRTLANTLYLDKFVGAHDDPIWRVSDPVIRKWAPARLLANIMTRVLLFLVVTARELVIHDVNDI